MGDLFGELTSAGAGGGAALTVAIALAAGMFAQGLARHLRMPGIVLLLGAGVLLGPDVLNIVRPGSLGPALQALVGFSVAIVLFEGGLNLHWRRIRREAAAIRLLITLGAAVTALGGALAARYVLGWSWSLSVLFGTLVIVTGPTVVTPLLRRVRVNKSLETVLEAEGVLIDAVGAITAVVALEIVISPTDTPIPLGFVSIPSRLVVGVLLGLVGGVAIALLLRVRRVVPEGLENVFTLSMALALFQLSNALMPETGIASVTVAGMVVGNMKTVVKRELKEFKEQLTVMMIGLLFVLLAADVRIDDVRALGWQGLVVVILLIFVVRPLNVLSSTFSSPMSWRDRVFIAWVAPRGIVAAAVSSLFADSLDASGIEGGTKLRALVFLVIAATVVVQGATVGPMASLLRVRRKSGAGYAILGASNLSRALAHELQRGGEEVVLLDANDDACREAEAEKLRVVFGNALEESALVRAAIDTRRAALGTLPNEAVNLLFATKAREEHRVPEGYVAIQRGHGSMTPKMVGDAGCRVLFGEPADIELWAVRLRRGIAEPLRTRFIGERAEESPSRLRLPSEMRTSLMPLATSREGKPRPVDNRTRLEPGDVVVWIVWKERREVAGKWLDEAGFEIVS